MGKPWESHELGMDKPWAGNEQATGWQWTSHGLAMDKPWAGNGQAVGFPKLAGGKIIL